MQSGQMQEQFTAVARSIDNAARACQAGGEVPEALRSCLSELDRESDQARQVIASGTSEQELQQCIERMEEIGDRAKEACKQADNIDPQLHDAVVQAHDAISSLKHQLH
ncbi:hypothetical protein [Noviherbaspirillum aridicola]|uniref:Uncharacterized protein n=1 Tax=Noviherbaspirillum aridicola TaxID=2849687 RepID=A0ABQ4PZ52_9BURK|nr:hypothetical protein [Noviherbaspirillum aridicola]GIZ50157.1 hypothetical protein NCCP691_01710 [Noviherbaspirillum aridicola]